MMYLNIKWVSQGYLVWFGNDYLRAMIRRLFLEILLQANTRPGKVHPHLDYPQFDYPQLDYPYLDYPQLNYPHLDYPHLD